MATFINSILGARATLTGIANLSLGPFRPPQWKNKPAMVSITVPPQQSSTSQLTPNASVPGGLLLQAPVNTQTTYVFDAVLSLEHDQRLEKTHHPVQTGASITSHAYLMPARLVLQVGMSDAMASYATSSTAAVAPFVTPFSGNPSKSVSAYQQILSLQAARVPLTVTTRLRTYTNMLITSVAPHEDSRTITGLRMRVEFEQIFTASVSLSDSSSRPQDTNSTGLGGVNVQPPSPSVVSQFNVSSVVGDLKLPSFEVPGAGNYSSTNINSLIP